MRYHAGAFCNTTFQLTTPVASPPARQRRYAVRHVSADIPWGIAVAHQLTDTVLHGAQRQFRFLELARRIAIATVTGAMVAVGLRPPALGIKLQWHTTTLAAAFFNFQLAYPFFHGEIRRPPVLPVQEPQYRYVPYPAGTPHWEE